MTTSVLWVLIVASNICYVAPQFVRERLFKTLMHKKSLLMWEVSDWTPGVNGYVNAIHRKFIWGKRAKELLAVDGAARHVWAMRLVDVVATTCGVGWVFFLCEVFMFKFV